MIFVICNQTSHGPNLASESVDIDQFYWKTVINYGERYQECSVTRELHREQKEICIKNWD